MKSLTPSTLNALFLFIVILPTYIVTGLIVAGIDDGSSPNCSQTCDYMDKDAYCGGRNLTTVPSRCNNSILLDLRGNNLHSLHKGSFQNFTDLKYLDLSDNYLLKLPSRVFSGAHNLKDVYVFNNRLTDVHHDAFADAGNLSSIYISKNEIQILPHSAFRGLLHLKVIFVSQNRLTYLNRQQFVHNRLLTHISFSYNRLELIHPETFRHLDRLFYLDLSYNNLHLLPSQSFHLSSLHTFKATHNNLTGEIISDKLLSLSNLKVVDLSNNHIEYIPTDISSSSLEKVRLAYNPLACDCSFKPLQDLYLQKLEDNDWMTDVSCSNGKSVIEASIICFEGEEEATSRQGETAVMGVKEIWTIEKEPQNGKQRFAVIMSVLISTICVGFMIYFVVCWVRSYIKYQRGQNNVAKEYKNKGNIICENGEKDSHNVQTCDYRSLV